MRKIYALSLVAICLLSLAGCGKSESDRAADAAAAGGDPMKAAAEVAFQFQPGQYRTTIDIQKVEIPGMPAIVAEQMKKAMTKTINQDHCISPEQAKQGVEAMKQHMGQGKCQFESFNARGGTVDSVFTCQTGADMALRSSSHGTYTATGSKLETKAEMKGPGGNKVKIEQTVTTTRIGECV
jgi:Protein of unknown function (DUF3617)